MSIADRPPLFFIIPCPADVTGGVYADHRIAEELQRRGWPVRLVYFADVREGMPRYRWRDQLAFNLRLLRELKHVPRGAILLEDQALSGAVALFNRFARRLRRAPVAVVTYHLAFNLWRNPVRRLSFRMVEGDVLRHADLVFASSRSTRKELIDLGVAPVRIRLITLGSSRAAPTSPSRDFVDQEGVTRILTVGTVEPRKGLEYLLRALATLGGEEWQLDVVGGLDVTYHAQLARLTQSLHISGRVQFRGRVADDELEDLMGRAHIFVQPSLGEGFGLAVLEAMERQLPVIASAAGALPELIAHEQTGLLVPPADAAALAEALRRLIGQPELRAALGRQAAASVKARYRWEETGRQIDEALLRLLAEEEGRVARGRPAAPL